MLLRPVAAAALLAAPASLVLSGPPARAQTSASPAAAAGAVPRLASEKYTLPNGLQVILHVDRKLPVVHVNEWFHVGSKNERTGRTGFAHLFEHMMFQGSKNAPGEYFSYIEKAGASLFTGGVNGTTSQDRTNYFATVPSGNLEYVLWIESDRLATLADVLTKEKLDNQRDVVKNERRQSRENVPYGRAFSLIFENLFPAGHPYGWDVIGSHEDLAAASLDDVRDFFRRYYTPNNLSLVIAGDFDPAEARRLVAKYFGPIPRGEPLERPARWVPALSGEKIVEARDRVPQERVYVAWPTPPLFEAGDAELDLAATILTDGLSSRLQKALVYDRPLCSNVSAFQGSGEISGTFTVQATARPGASLDDIERTITSEIGRLAKSGPTPAELNRAKVKWETQFVSALEKIGGFGGKADRLNQYNTFFGAPNKFEADLRRYGSATPAGVRAVVARWLDTPGRLLLRFRPEPASGSAAGAQTAGVTAPPLDRSQIPPLASDKPFRAPDVQQARLSNGLEIFVARRPELPKVAVVLATRAGSVTDPPGKSGRANLATTALALGTRTRNALGIADTLNDLGVTLNTAVTSEDARVSFDVLKRNLVPALTLAADVVQNPTFPQAEVERERKRLLDTLAQQANDPLFLAQRLSFALAFGPNHPYANWPSGTPAAAATLTPGDLSAHHGAYWKPGGSALIFVGDITLEEARRLAEQAFGRWSGGAGGAVALPAPRRVETAAAAGRVFLLDRPGAAQTVVVHILPGPKRRTQDYPALVLADTVWGGGFMTRLNLNLRENKGYSYGMQSLPVLLREAGLWVAGGGVQTDKTAESVTELTAELKNIGGAKPITETELADARANRVRSYAQNFESLGQIAAQISDLWLFGLPLSDLQTRSDELTKTPLDAVNAAARKYAVPEQATLLLIGDRAKIEPRVRALNLGEIVVIDAEGKPIPAGR